MGQAHRCCRLCLRRPRQPRQLLWLLVDPSLIRNATPAILSPARCLRLSLMSLSIIGQTLRSRSRSRSRHRSLLSSVTGLIGFISHRNRLSALLFEPSLCAALLCSLSAVHFSFELLPWLVAFAAFAASLPRCLSSRVDSNFHLNYFGAPRGCSDGEGEGVGPLWWCCPARANV